LCDLPQLEHAVRYNPARQLVEKPDDRVSNPVDDTHNRIPDLAEETGNLSEEPAHRLHERLVQRGRVTNGIDITRLKKKKRSPEEIDRWFKDGLKLSSPAEAFSNAEDSQKR